MDLLEHFRYARKVQVIPAGAVLFREGDEADVMYVLMEGAANVLVVDTLVEIAGPGTLLGEMALVDRQQRSATVVTRTPCRLVSVDAHDFELLILETPAFARHVMKVMAERLRRMNDSLRETKAALGASSH